MKLPKGIKDKIKKVVEYERLKLLTMQEITEWNPKLKEPIIVMDEGWDWEMYFRGSLFPVHKEYITSTILSAITGKRVEPRFSKQKTITLSELRKKYAK